MATVTGLTAARMIEIEDASIVSGTVTGNDLILTNHGGSTINAGNVRGPVGPVGPAVASLNDVADVTVPSPTTGDLLTWNGSAWAATPPTNPVGLIQMYAHPVPPTGFLLCDGATIPAGAQYDDLRALIGGNTPDLRSKFIFGADPADVDLLETGGAKTVTLTSGQIPAHNHGDGTLATNTTGSHSHLPGGGGSFVTTSGNNNAGLSVSPGGNPSAFTQAAGSHAHDVTGSTANNTPSGSAHNNMPPYIGLYFVIRY